MNFQLKIALILYIVNILVMLAIGFVYQFSSEFMSFHSAVIQTQWQDVDALPKVLYIGMMRTEAAGFLASGVALSILLFIPFMKHEKWSYWAMSIIGIVEYLPTLFATHHVASITDASPPWLLMLTLILSLLLALGFAISGSSNKLVQGYNNDRI